MLLHVYTCSFCIHGHRLKGGNYYYKVSFFWFFFWLLRHLVNDNSFKIVDFYLIHAGHKLSGFFTQSQILLQHIARPNDNDNVLGVDTMYVCTALKTRILRVLHIAIHCPLQAKKIRGPKILEVSPYSD